MLTLKEHSDIEDRLLEQPALGANLVGADGLMFKPKGDIQDRDILPRIGSPMLAFASSQGLTPHEEGHSTGRQGDLAGTTEELSAGGDKAGMRDRLYRRHHEHS